MNKSTFILTGGYPLKAERLQELQTAYSIFNSLGALAGNFTIISGCVVAGTTVGNGIVYINGEVIEFREADGAGTPDVIIIEEAVNRAFKNGVIKQVHTIRYATFGTAADSWPWSGFNRPDPIILMMARLEVLEKKSAVFQAGGGMVFWNKPAADIPAGWQEVVDWRGRMPVGFDVSQPEFNTMGKDGGAKNKTLSVAEMPSHSHAIGNSRRNTGGGSGGDENHPKSYAGVRDHITDTQGSGQEFSILNPYRTVLFIEYTL
jgi:hypothetical protein